MDKSRRPATDNDFLKYHGATTDLNLALKNGLWVYTPSTANRPSNANYGLCIVLNNGSASYHKYAWFYQFAFENEHIYTRRSLNVPNASGWTSWATVK
jgi:hypothetical protein